MTVMDAVNFFCSAHVIVCHSDTSLLRAYAVWIEERYLEAPTYLDLAVVAKKRHDDLVTKGVLEGPIVQDRVPYAGAEGMNVTWPKKDGEP